MSYVLSEIVVPLILAVLLGLLIGWLLWRFRRTQVTYTEWEFDGTQRPPLPVPSGGGEVIDLRFELESANTRISQLTEELAGARGPGADPTLFSTATGLGTGLFGAGSHAPSEDGSQPDGYPIKGNVDSMLYHRPDSRNYGATVAEAWFDTPERAEQAGFRLAPTHPASGRATNFDPALHPFGPGSHVPFEDGSQPHGYPIKGNVDSMLYHRSDSRNYGATVAEAWFDTPERAEQAGFRLAPTHPTD